MRPAHPHTRARRPRAALLAFTLLEVMMAIAILAICLTAIYSSQGGAVRMAHRSRKIGVATLLARCKMGELEEQVAEEGLPALFDSGSDECCEDGEVEGYKCEWEIVPVVLPETMFAGEEGQDGESGSPTMLDSLADAKEQGSSLDPAAMLAGGGTDGLAAMALGFVFPVLKPAFEAQIRRATVIVRWNEGNAPHELDVTQYMVSPTPIVAATGAQAEGETGTGMMPGTGTQPGTGMMPGTGTQPGTGRGNSP